MTPGQAPPEYQTPNTLAPIPPRSQPANRLHGPPSSPAIGLPGVDQNQLLDDFFEWYIQKYGGAGGGPRLEKIKEAHWALKEDFEEVGTMVVINNIRKRLRSERTVFTFFYVPWNGFKKRVPLRSSALNKIVERWRT